MNFQAWISVSKHLSQLGHFPKMEMCPERMCMSAEQAGLGQSIPRANIQALPKSLGIRLDIHCF
jgi:hypothetical protein